MGLSSFESFSQTTKPLIIVDWVITDSLPLGSIFKKPLASNFKDSLAFVMYSNEIQKKAYALAYLDFSVDSIQFSPSEVNWKAFVHLGRAYPNCLVRIKETDRQFLSELNGVSMESSAIPLTQLWNRNQKIIETLQNNGYPQAKVKLDHFAFYPDSITAFLNIEKGPHYVFDKLAIKGDLQVSKSFLAGYTGIKKGQDYSHQKLIDLNQKLNGLGFGMPIANPSVNLLVDTVQIELPIKKVSNNRFDGILGIVPNDKTTGKLLLTGELNIQLQNIAKQGEQIDLQWHKLQAASQDLLLNFKIPYLFNTNIGTSTGFKLLKQDSTYINLLTEFGLQYYFGSRNYIGLTYRYSSSDMLQADSLLAPNSWSYVSNQYGLSFNYQKLDYPFNPHRGYSIQTNAFIGNKKVLKEPISTVQQFQFDYNLQYYWYLSPRSTLLTKHLSSFSEAPLFSVSELSRIGGLKTVRGFNESSLYTTSYGILSLEYRYIFEKNSALFAFVDAAWFELKGQPYYYNYPLGLGLGMFFKTKAGIFTLSYAVGRTQEQNFELKSAKIHFGIIGQF